MSIISLEFFVFLGIAVLVYYAVPLHLRWAALLLASAGFVLIGTKSVVLFAVFVLMTLLAWGAALWIAKAETEKAKNRITAASVLILAGILIFFKDSSFFVINLNLIGGLFGCSPGFEAPAVRAPYGISYFTLILISYIVDVRWGAITQPQANPLKMLAFAGYFPHLASGPFTRYNDIRERLYEGNRFDYDNFCFGLQRFLWGLFKKLVIADNLAPMVAAVYERQPSLLTVICGGWLYVLQLYTDFSGCMDIVLGCSQLFGIPMKENFNTPFYSVSLQEWWRRWHITLGLWLKDYIMYPLQKTLTGKFGAKLRGRFGKKAGKAILLHCSTLVLWFCVGFWHGGSWKYICSSGLFFWVMITAGELLNPAFNRLADGLRINRDCWSWRMFQRIRTFLLFSVAVSFGRTESLRSGVARFLSGITHWRISSDLSALAAWIRGASGLLGKLQLMIPFGGLCVLFLISLLQHHYGSVRTLLAKQNLVFRWAVLLGMLAFVLIFGAYGPAFVARDFIYEQF